MLLSEVLTLCAGRGVDSRAADVHPSAPHHVLAHGRGPRLAAGCKEALALQPRPPGAGCRAGEGSHHTQLQGRTRRRRRNSLIATTNSTVLLCHYNILMLEGVVCQGLMVPHVCV